ncbi:hypothetical protein BDZ89DRAFT_176579 [Hymenopellis radicata]|nr:hypothetical protein BDZ89DRAFT_176579 [Hymenopellis radicata]
MDSGSRNRTGTSSTTLIHLWKPLQSGEKRHLLTTVWLQDALLELTGGIQELQLASHVTVANTIAPRDELHAKTVIAAEHSYRSLTLLYLASALPQAVDSRVSRLSQVLSWEISICSEPRFGERGVFGHMF